MSTDDTTGFDTDDFLNDLTDADLAAYATATGESDGQATDDDGVDDVEHAGVAPGEPGSTATDPATGQPEPLYADYAEFMVGFIGQVVSRKLNPTSGGGLRWDENWWRYPEAVFRAELMWRTFEVARIDPDPSAMESWTRTVMDYHLNVLLNGSIGPMNDASGPQQTLPMTRPPQN
ncbi:DUF4913 domain-containing protein [Corynebacterium variabile]|uniref:DUF4913 domain-containing protein n=1 Tax=Corynebacterium variabile TaxID=1727 RepID=UPI003BB16D87